MVDTISNTLLPNFIRVYLGFSFRIIKNCKTLQFGGIKQAHAFRFR
jgi:hypothetical protein